MVDGCYDICVNAPQVVDGGKLLVVDGKLQAEKNDAMIQLLVDYVLADAQIRG